MAVVFLSFLFSTLGLSMLFLSQAYMKSLTFRKNSICLDYASENGAKDSIHRLLEHVSGNPTLHFISDGDVLDFKSDASAGGTRLIEEASGLSFPVSIQESWKNMRWSSTVRCNLGGFIDQETHGRGIYSVLIDSEGMLSHFNAARHSQVRAEMTALAGNLPLPYLPFLIDKPLTEDEKADYLNGRNITLRNQASSLLPAQPQFTQGGAIPDEADALVAKALKIHMFYPQNLSRTGLRKALGLEMIDEPVPDGVYLVRDDMGLGGVFVQGDLDRVMLAIDGEYQVLLFRGGPGDWMLRFSLSECRTVFISPGGTEVYDLVPLGIIVVNGKIDSLGSGTVEPPGNIVPAGNQEIPCVLRGLSLTIISSDSVQITSHLIAQSLKWQNGVPYIKDGRTQLMIFASGKDFVENTEKAGEITIGADSPQNIKISGSLTGKKAVSILGKGKEAEILGSLHAGELFSAGNSLRITVDDRYSAGNLVPGNVPLSAVPMLYLASFRILEWREY
ncbi:MAG TPA: hypothetical protein PLX50_02645 [Candidatus Aminicenantes bacterium]|nr:hypothetical protein [Candidatus Aminicenantes bacterium]